MKHIKLKNSCNQIDTYCYLPLELHFLLYKKKYQSIGGIEYELFSYKITHKYDLGF